MKVLVILLLLISTQAVYSQWESCNNGLTGGSVQCILLSDDLILIGTKNGVYASIDSGKKWIPKRKGLANLDIISLLRKDNLWFAGTNGGGLYKSTNQGELWIRQKDSITNGIITSLAAKNDYIFAGTHYNGLYLSTDNGSNWQRKNIVPDTKGSVTTVTFKGDTIYVGLSIGGLFFSTDNAESWSAKNTGRSEIGVHCMAISGNDIFVSSAYTLYHSNDNGNNWNAKTKSSIFANITTINANKKNLYIKSSTSIKHSVDNGDNWTIVSQNMTTSRVLCISTNTNGLFVGTENGLFHTNNNGLSWNMKSNGLENISISSLAYNTSAIYAGTYGNGVFKSSDNGDSWLSINSGFDTNRVSQTQIIELLPYKNEMLAGTNGDGMYRLPEGSDTWIRSWEDDIAGPYTNSQILAISCSENTIYGGTWDGLFSSTDNGETWVDTKVDSIKMKVNAISNNIYGTFAGTPLGVSFSSDNGKTWERRDAGIESKHIYAFESVDNKVFVGTERCGLYTLSEDGKLWTLLPKVTNSYQPINKITVKDNNMFVLVNKVGIFLSSDLGNTWNDVNFKLPVGNVYSIKVIGDYIFAGTFGNGLFRAKITDLLYAVSVEENHTNKEHYLYTFPPFPNPATKEVRSLVYWDTSSHIEQDEIGIYNINGAKVSDRSKISFDKLNLYSGYLIWNCAGIETGVYIIVIKHGTATRTIKVMVN